MKNNSFSVVFLCKRRLKTLFRIFNLATLLSLLFILNLSASVYSQNKMFSLNMKDARVRDVLHELEQQSKFRFFYNDEFAYIDKVVDVQVYNENVEQILEKIFESSEITYRVLENNLVVLTVKQEPEQQTVTGTVTDASTGEKLPGVNIAIKGTARGTITDSNGFYSLEVDPGEILVFSYVGYINKEIIVENQTQIDIVLELDIQSLEEIVVIGYGVQKKSSVTGAISNVSSKDVNELPVASIESALQGRAAGISVVNNGTPGTEPIVRIRGNGSISYAATPLYVVDGFPTTEMVNFDASDIESIEILKDAAATAIYGSRAANGVVLITTKKGQKDGKVHVNFDAFQGVQSLHKKLDLLNTDQYLDYAAAFVGSNPELTMPSRIRDNFNDPIYEGADQTFAETDTDWQDELFRNAPMSEANVSFSLSNDKSVFYGSGGFYKQKGIMIGTSYERFNVRLNSEHDLTKSIKIGQTFMYSDGARDNEKRSQGRSNVMHAIRNVPYLPVYDPTKDGGFIAADNSDGTDPDNPVKVQKLFRSTTSTSKLFGTMYLDISLTSYLNFKTTAGLDITRILNNTGEPIYNDGFNSNTTAATRRQNIETSSRLFTNQLTFNKDWGKHNVNVVAVAEQQSFQSRVMFISGNLPTNLVSELTGLTNVTANGRKEENLLLSYLGRINYEFDNKYLLSAAMRADGSSKFAPGNKWGYFPSASLGWRVDQESFMEAIPAISQLKLRAGYGEVGNNNIGNYDWQAVILANTAYVFNNADVPGSYFNSIPNEDLTWETSKMTNVGLDLGLWENRLSFTAEYFTKRTENLILNVPIAVSMGITAPYYANVGEMKNDGVEFELGYRLDAGNLTSNISGNISFVRNEVLSLWNPIATVDRGQHPDFGGYEITRTMVGEPIQSFYGWVTDGIFQNQEEIDNHATQTVGTNPTNSTSPGDIRFKDLSGPEGVPDGVIDSYDRTFLGSYLPKFSYGLHYDGSFKNFDFSLFFQGTQGNKIYNGTKVISQGMIRLFNADEGVLNAWTPANTDTDIPRVIDQDPNKNTRTSDRFIEDGSYLRLKSLTIGYSLPDRIMESLTKGSMSTARIYVTGVNLLTFTNYSGMDPEVGVQVPIANGIATVATDADVADLLLRNGIDYGLVPQPRSVTVGIQVGF